MIVVVSYPGSDADMHRPIDSARIEVVDDALAEVLRKKSPAQRIQMIGDANHTARILAAGGVRYQHPDWDDAQVQAEVLKRVCGGTA
jgi:hypothetical protein